MTYAYNKDMNKHNDTASNLHAHVETESRDCDGMYTSGYVAAMTTLERNEEFSDLVFKDRVITGIISVHAYGTLTVTPDGVTWGESTEEGYRRVEATWCSDTCPGSSWQRDHTAEAAGY